MGGREQDGDRDWDTGHRGDGIDLLHLNRWMRVCACFVGDGVDKLAAAVATASGTCARYWLKVCACGSHPMSVALMLCPLPSVESSTMLKASGELDSAATTMQSPGDNAGSGGGKGGDGGDGGSGGGCGGDGGSGGDGGDGGGDAQTSQPS